MKISVRDLSKRFGHEWIFRKINTDFTVGEPTAIIGNNGSGKSTLLKVISGMLPPSEGRIEYSEAGGREIVPEKIYRHTVWAAPYTEIIEEMNPAELYRFHSRFMPLKYSFEEFFDKLAVKAKSDKIIKLYSSGMKQKLKLALAFYSEANILLLDEPTANFDRLNTDWYQNEIVRAAQNRIVLIASNLPAEYEICTKKVDIRDYKIGNSDR